MTGLRDSHSVLLTIPGQPSFHIDAAARMNWRVMLSSEREFADNHSRMKDWMTEEERAELGRAERWTRLHALAMMVGLVALLITALLMVLPQ